MNDIELFIRNSVPYIIDVSIASNIKRTFTTDFDVNGKPYRKQIAYMENTTRIGNILVKILAEEPKVVCNVIYYIINHLSYNRNIIELSPREIAKEIGNTESNISKAITRCGELTIIKRLNTVKGYEAASRKLWIVNHNYIFNSSIQELDNAYNRLKQSNNNNGSKSKET